MIKILTRIAFYAALSISAQAVPVLSFTGGTVGTSGAGPDFNAGWEFSTSVESQLQSLGFFDFGGNGLTRSYEVGLWTVAGTLVASTTVSTTDALVGQFRYHSVTPVTLAAGNYIVGALVSTQLPDELLFNATVTTTPGVTFVNARNGTGPTLAVPTVVRPGFNGGLFGPSLQLVLAPELDTAGAVLPLAFSFVGLALLAGQRRRLSC